MSLNLNDKVPPGQTRYTISQSFTDAVNDAYFVRMFGVVALICSILNFITPAVTIGVGLAILGFGRTRYYRLLGIAVIVLAFLSSLLTPFVGSLVLSAGIAFKGVGVLGVLGAEGKDDPDWQETRNKALTGVALCLVAFLITGASMILTIVGLFMGKV